MSLDRNFCDAFFWPAKACTIKQLNVLFSCLTRRRFKRWSRTIWLGRTRLSFRDYSMAPNSSTGIRLWRQSLTKLSERTWKSIETSLRNWQWPRRMRRSRRQKKSRITPLSGTCSIGALAYKKILLNSRWCSTSLQKVLRANTEQLSNETIILFNSSKKRTKRDWVPTSEKIERDYQNQRRRKPINNMSSLASQAKLAISFF